MSISTSTSNISKKIESQLITVTEVAEQLAISARSVWRLVSAGKFVAPIKVGGATRWRKDDVTNWIAAGCPEQPSPKKTN